MKKRLLCLAIMLVLIMTSCGQKTDTAVKPELDQIHSICKLATLKCYYNNVAKSEKEGAFLQKDRKFWIEYSGIVKIGIDFSLVRMKLDGNDVTITLPEANIQSLDADEATLTEDSYVLSDDGLISNEITAEDQTKAIADAQAEMRETVQNNTGLFVSARERAKKLIENYINKIGEIRGENYKINWEYIDDKTSDKLVEDEESKPSEEPSEETKEDSEEK